MTFAELNLDERILEAISYMGFETATPVQEKVIPLALDNKDVIACAQTGTGKTGSFVLPILNKLAVKKSSETDTLVIVPTRELAIQIEQQIQVAADLVGFFTAGVRTAQPRSRPSSCYPFACPQPR